MKVKALQVLKVILNTKNNDGGIIKEDFKLCCRAIVKDRQTHRQTDQHGIDPKFNVWTEGTKQKFLT